MMKRICVLLLAHVLSLHLHAQVKADRLLTEGLKDPEAIDNTLPRFSWQLITTQPNTLQSAYEILVMDGKQPVWQSGKVLSDQSIYVPYKGDSLAPGKKYTWKVRVWDQQQKASPWSATAYFRMGITSWKAKWIASTYIEPKTFYTSPAFNTTYRPARKIASAIAYITSQGMYEAFINGKRIGNGMFTPGFTQYAVRYQYQAYDVTNLLQPGDNNIDVTLGSGWYRTNFLFGTGIYGNILSLLYQMEVTYTDGSRDTIVSDEKWRSGLSKILYSDLYNGEMQDNRRDSIKWVGVRIKNDIRQKLVASVSTPVVKLDTLRKFSIIKTPAGETVLDFSQNFSGFVQFTVNGKRGDTIIIDHGETLDHNGNFYNENLRTAAARDVFILKGDGPEFFEPHFTYHGFRYIRIRGLEKNNAEIKNIAAVVLSSDLAPTGNFQCSDPLINQLQHNIQWSQKSNFIDIPTDCPQRDERLGWLGDAQVFSQTATFNNNVNTFFNKWLGDLVYDQYPDGNIPNVVPNVLLLSMGSAGYADAVTVVPWAMYQAYGDKKVLEDLYPSMQRWINYVNLQTKNGLWVNGTHFGDWLSYKSDSLIARSADTDPNLIAQCFFALSTQNMINIARVLGKKEDEKIYTHMLRMIKAAFVAEYVTANGRVLSNTQTAYTLALAFDMLPVNLRPAAATYLVENIKKYDYHLTTGFLGTYLLSNTLSKCGYTDVAYRLLLQETYPSWLYPVKQGATTIWERWDGKKPDGSFQNTAMNSFNHYAYGAIGDWMYKTIAGINMDTAAIAFKKIIIKPQPGGRITFAKASYDCSYGKISVDWHYMQRNFIMDVEIPPNTTAEIFVPSPDGKTFTQQSVGSGKYHFESAPDPSTINKALAAKTD
jgi:alpha-L-rhamnosidase